MTLTEVDDVLRWEFGGGTPPTQRHMRRRGRSGRAVSDGFIQTVKLEKLPPNEISCGLIDLDQDLTPNRGLREINPSTDQIGLDPARPRVNGRILLLVHGTFSNCKTMLGELSASVPGQAFVSGILSGVPSGDGPYQQVFAFSHAMLTVLPPGPHARTLGLGPL